MPTPASLEASVSQAAIRSAAAEAKTEVEKEEAAGTAIPDEDPDSIWSAKEWMKTLHFDELLAETLMQPLRESFGSSSGEVNPRLALPFFRALGKSGAHGKDALLSMLRDGDVLQRMADSMWPKLVALSGSEAATATELTSKFVSGGVGFDLEYGGLKSFFGGLEAVVGAPNPSVRLGMTRDHCESADSDDIFLTPNYSMNTTARAEWWFVADPDRGLVHLAIDKYPAEAPETIHDAAMPRRPLPAVDFQEAMREKNLELHTLEQPPIDEEEFIGARLYTGPCFVKYNTVLRGSPAPRGSFFHKKFMELCKGNKYCTTLHVINSAVVKLSKLTVASKVYRGVSGGRLPLQFRVANEYGVRGGIDPSFISTTTDREVALAYAVADRAVGDLYVLDLGGLARHAVGVTTRLDAHQLQLDGADGGGAVLDEDLAGERLVHVAHDGVELPRDLEGGDLVQRGLAHVLQ